MKIEKHQVIEMIVEHGKNIERLRCIAKKILRNEKRVSEDENLRSDILKDFKGVIKSLTPDNYLPIKNKNSLILQSIVSERIKICEIGDLFYWLLKNRVREAFGLVNGLSNMLNEYCSQSIYRILLTNENEKYKNREIDRDLEGEKRNAEKRQRWSYLQRKSLDEYLKQYGKIKTEEYQEIMIDTEPEYIEN